jgi:hypothetical protein
VFTARYGLNPYITQIRLVLKKVKVHTPTDTSTRDVLRTKTNEVRCQRQEWSQQSPTEVQPDTEILAEDRVQFLCRPLSTLY